MQIIPQRVRDLSNATGSTDIGPWVAELRMIENIAKDRLELERDPFMDSEILQGPEIQVLLGWPGNRVVADIAKSSDIGRVGAHWIGVRATRYLESGGIEPFIDCSAARRYLADAGHNVGPAAEVIRIRGIKSVERGGKPLPVL